MAEFPENQRVMRMGGVGVRHRAVSDAEELGIAGSAKTDRDLVGDDGVDRRGVWGKGITI